MSRPSQPLSTAMLEAAVDLLAVSGQYGMMTVEGASMLPTFRGVGRIWVAFSPRDLAFGDLIVFRQRGILVVHRLLQRSAERLRSRGDGVISFDPWVDPQAVIGRVVAIEQADGRWRRLHGARPRFYAWKVGAHDLFWGGVGALLLKFGGRWGADWHWRMGRVDAFLLRCVHGLLFRAFHPICPRPGDDLSNGPVVEARCYTAARMPSPKKSCS